MWAFRQMHVFVEKNHESRVISFFNKKLKIVMMRRILGCGGDLTNEIIIEQKIVSAGYFHVLKKWKKCNNGGF